MNVCLCEYGYGKKPCEEGRAEKTDTHIQFAWVYKTEAKCQNKLYNWAPLVLLIWSCADTADVHVSVRFQAKWKKTGVLKE